MTKPAGNITILVAGSILMIGGLIAVAALFLGSTVIVLLRRMTPPRALKGGQVQRRQGLA
jgi:hypothetical protein